MATLVMEIHNNVLAFNKFNFCALHAKVLSSLVKARVHLCLASRRYKIHSPTVHYQNICVERTVHATETGNRTPAHVTMATSNNG